MAEVIRMPRLSDTMTEGIISSWHKNVGDQVKPGDVLADVETDKATMELESYNEGTLLYIGVEKGKGVPVDGILAIVGKPGEDYKKLLEKETTSTTTATGSEGASPKEQIKTEIKSMKASPKTELPEGAKEIR